jgi:hypothetical protein
MPPAPLFWRSESFHREGGYVKEVPLSPADIARFEAKVDRSGGLDVCHPWTAGRTRDGYGQFSVGNRKFRAHRVAYFLAYGSWPWPETRHTCNNRPCCNYRHLVTGTGSENAHDGRAKVTPAIRSFIVDQDRRLRPRTKIARMVADEFGVAVSSQYISQMLGPRRSAAGPSAIRKGAEMTVAEAPPVRGRPRKITPEIEARMRVLDGDGVPRTIIAKAIAEEFGVSVSSQWVSDMLGPRTVRVPDGRATTRIYATPDALSGARRVAADHRLLSAAGETAGEGSLSALIEAIGNGTLAVVVPRRKGGRRA